MKQAKRPHFREKLRGAGSNRQVVGIRGDLVTSSATTVSSPAWILLSGDPYSSNYGQNAAVSIIPFSQPDILTIPLGFAALVIVSLRTRKQTQVV